MSIIINIVGWLATALAAGMTIPQTWSSLKHKKVEGVSFVTYSILLIGFLLWVLQSSLIESYQGFFANSIASIFTIPVVYMIYKLNITRRAMIAWRSLLTYIIILFSFSILMFIKKDIFDKSAKDAIVLSIGIVAGILTTFSFVPQVIQEFKTTKISHQSLLTILAYGSANLFWIIHFSGRFWYVGDITLSGAFPLFLWGSITFSLQTLYAIRIVYKRKKYAISNSPDSPNKLITK